MRPKVLILGVTAFVAAAMVAGQPAQAAPHWDRTCGLFPGDGAFSFVKAKNTTCRRARKVTRKAGQKFCRKHNDCQMRTDTGFYKGRITRNGWRCKVAVGWEYFRAKCRRGNMIVLGMSGA